MFLSFELFGLLIFPESEEFFSYLYDHLFTRTFIKKLVNIYLCQALYSKLGSTKDGRDLYEMEHVHCQRAQTSLLSRYLRPCHPPQIHKHLQLSSDLWCGGPERETDHQDDIVRLKEEWV